MFWRGPVPLEIRGQIHGSFCSHIPGSSHSIQVFCTDTVTVGVNAQTVAETLVFRLESFLGLRGGREGFPRRQTIHVRKKSAYGTTMAATMRAESPGAAEASNHFSSSASRNKQVDLEEIPVKPCLPGVYMILALISSNLRHHSPCPIKFYFYYGDGHSGVVAPRLQVHQQQLLYEESNAQSYQWNLKNHD